MLCTSRKAEMKTFLLNSNGIRLISGEKILLELASTLCFPEVPDIVNKVSQFQAPLLSSLQHNAMKRRLQIFGFGHFLDRFFGFCIVEYPVFRFAISFSVFGLPAFLSFSFRCLVGRN